MLNSTLAQWYVSDNICALCDSERHLAHVVQVGGRWLAFDATHPNGQGVGCVFVGSFARKLTAMEAAEAETLHMATASHLDSEPAIADLHRLASAA